MFLSLVQRLSGSSTVRLFARPGLFCIVSAAKISLIGGLNCPSLDQSGPVTQLTDHCSVLAATAGYNSGPAVIRYQATPVIKLCLEDVKKFSSEKSYDH